MRQAIPGPAVPRATAGRHPGQSTYGTTSYVSWYAELWLAEPLTLRAWTTLLGVRRFFGVTADETLPALLHASQEHQHEVTDQLGKQVRHAVELLVQAIDRNDQERHGALLADVPLPDLYEAAVTVMMRLVFLLSAEERGLLPADDELYSQFYAAGDASRATAARGRPSREEVVERQRDAWPRLLAPLPRSPRRHPPRPPHAARLWGWPL